MKRAAHTPQIAIFDSGVGGLTVASAIHQLLPWCDLRYLGDTARLPYGTKSASTVLRYALQVADALVTDAGTIDALVVACNTASACALPALRARHPFPVLGVIEPGADRAVATTRSGHIGVIGTERTIASAAYAQAIASRDPKITVHGLATPLLVALAEEGWFDHPVTDATLDAYLGPFLADPQVAQIDTLVLGCTHYPVFKAALGRALGRILDHEVTLVDSAEAIAQEVAKLLAAAGHAAVRPGRIALYATDVGERFERVGRYFLPLSDVPICAIDL